MPEEKSQHKQKCPLAVNNRTEINVFSPVVGLIHCDEITFCKVDKMQREHLKTEVITKRGP